MIEFRSINTSYGYTMIYIYVFPCFPMGLQGVSPGLCACSTPWRLKVGFGFLAMTKHQRSDAAVEPSHTQPITRTSMYIYIYIHVYTFLNLSLSLCRYISQSTHTKKHSTSGTSHDVDYLRTLTASPWASEDCLATCCGTTRRCSRWTWHRKRDMDATAPRLSMVGVFFWGHFTSRNYKWWIF